MPARPPHLPDELTSAGRYIILIAAFLGWMFSGFQMAVMTLTARSATTEFLRSGQLSASQMLHAERLTRVLCDEAIAERLLAQAQAHPERREVLERWVERAEPRCRGLVDEITSTGDRLLARLRTEDGKVEEKRIA